MYKWYSVLFFLPIPAVNGTNAITNRVNNVYVLVVYKHLMQDYHDSGAFHVTAEKY